MIPSGCAPIPYCFFNLFSVPFLETQHRPIPSTIFFVLFPFSRLYFLPPPTPPATPLHPLPFLALPLPQPHLPTCIPLFLHITFCFPTTPCCIAHAHTHTFPRLCPFPLPLPPHPLGVWTYFYHVTTHLPVSTCCVLAGRRGCSFGRHAYIPPRCVYERLVFCNICLPANGVAFAIANGAPYQPPNGHSLLPPTFLYAISPPSRCLLAYIPLSCRTAAHALRTLRYAT